MSESQPPVYEFETGMYRPPSEGGSASLLLRLTRNCPWNHCTFCAMYKHEKFELRKPGEVIGEIDTMAAVKMRIQQISKDQGTLGELTRQSVETFLKDNPSLYFHPGISMLINWLAVGAKTVFLQDADSLIMKTKDFIDILIHLKKTFPSVERVTTYARSRTIVKKKLSELTAIKNAGLDQVHIGLESGDEAVLKAVKKGATPEDHVKGGKKALEAGFQVSEYWMPGLGGAGLSNDHAAHTADVLNQINPHYIRSRPFTPRPGSPLYDTAIKKGLDRQSPKAQLEEVRQMIQALDVTSKVCFDHAGNYWKSPGGGLLLTHDYEGYRFPEQKPYLLDLLEKGIGGYADY